MVRQSGRYCRRSSQCLVNAAVVEIRDELRDGRFVILPLLAVPIGQPRVAAQLHADRLVLPLAMTRANTILIRRADD
jgi:hypothetical protein